MSNTLSYLTTKFLTLHRALVRQTAGRYNDARNKNHRTGWPWGWRCRKGERISASGRGYNEASIKAESNDPLCPPFEEGWILFYHSTFGAPHILSLFSIGICFCILLRIVPEIVRAFPSIFFSLPYASSILRCLNFSFFPPFFLTLFSVKISTKYG